MKCLICSVSFLEIASWRKLLLIKSPQLVCEKCLNKFEKAEERNWRNEWIGTVYEGTLDSVTSIYSYNDWMKQVYQQYKFQLDVELANIFRADFLPLLKVKEKIVPIPLHPDMLVARTFSQVDELLIAANVSYHHVLSKTLNHSQVGKSKKERVSSELLFTVTQDVQKQHILLIDDLYTTGTTLHHAAYVLKKAGASSVNALTLIRA
ncbi:MAG: phosphoribosyltransferase family protein [Paenisporosarcina sp.]|uniref:ComF family protein n=1 Tax=Paenisporosarcina sp. TaxID=1932001 RepID=UPI003C747533